MLAEDHRVTGYSASTSWRDRQRGLPVLLAIQAEGNSANACPALGRKASPGFPPTARTTVPSAVATADRLTAGSRMKTTLP
jgi:hypothetical protein